jgi:hypothetical protein
MVSGSNARLQLGYSWINAVWEGSRRLGVLTQLYRERVDDWRLLKCVHAYAKHVGEVRNAKLVRLLERVMDWLRIRMSYAYRRGRERLRELSQAGKFRLGVWGSAGLRGELLRAYLALKNGSAPAGLLVDLYS